MMQAPRFRAQLTTNAHGDIYEFDGPNLRDRYSRRYHGVAFMQPINEWAARQHHERPAQQAEYAEHIVFLLEQAFEAGRHAKAAEIREALGMR